MTSFMKGTSNTPVLGKGAEARLAAILQRGRQLDFLAASLKKAGKGRTISDAELAAEAGLVGPADVARRRKNAAEARDLLLQYNVRLVINIAKRYTASGIDIADLIPGGWVLGSIVGPYACKRLRPCLLPQPPPPLTICRLLPAPAGLQRAWWAWARRWTALSPAAASSSAPTRIGGSARQSAAQ
jgi:hypothetical protein